MDDDMKLWALCDLHLSHSPNREALGSLPAPPDDWLLPAGDVTDGFRHLDWCFDTLNRKFGQLVWVPGNHELRTRPRCASGLRGAPLCAKFVKIAPSSCASTAFRSRKSLSAIRTSGTAGVASDTTSTRWFWRRSALLVKTADRTWWRPFRALDGIDVIHVDLGPDPNHEKDALAWLDRAETERLRRFRIARPRREFALCRAALRINLCNRLDCTNHRLSFGFHEHGKPFALVEGRAASDQLQRQPQRTARTDRVRFAGTPPGTDRDRRGGAPGRDRDFDGIAGTVFGAQERAALAAAWGDDKVRLFYRLWTLKEALIKALGTGFSLAPARFEYPRGHGPRGGFGGISLSPCARGPMAAHLSARYPICRRHRLQNRPRRPVRMPSPFAGARRMRPGGGGHDSSRPDS